MTLPFQKITLPLCAALLLLLSVGHTHRVCAQDSPQKTDPPTPPTIVVFGDSLSAEYGLRRGAGWATLLVKQLAAQGLPHKVVNASISGETTAGGRVRLAAVLEKYRPSLVILELGANDGLRGLPISQIRSNLTAMADTTQQFNSRLVIVGMKIPPNYGPQYARQFESVFAEVARNKNALLVPFLLEGVAQNPELFQADGIHPTEKAQAKIFDNVWKVLSGTELLQP